MAVARLALVVLRALAHERQLRTRVRVRVAPQGVFEGAVDTGRRAIADAGAEALLGAETALVPGLALRARARCEVALVTRRPFLGARGWKNQRDEHEHGEREPRGRTHRDRAYQRNSVALIMKSRKRVLRSIALDRARRSPVRAASSVHASEHRYRRRGLPLRRAVSKPATTARRGSGLRGESSDHRVRSSISSPWASPRRIASCGAA